MTTKGPGRPKKIRLDFAPELTNAEHAQAAAFYAQHEGHITEFWRKEHWLPIAYWGGMAKSTSKGMRRPVRHVRYLDACALSGMHVDAIAVAYQEQCKFEVVAMLVKRTSDLFRRLTSEVPDDLGSLPDDLRHQFTRAAMTTGPDMLAVRQRDLNNKAATEAWIVEAVRKARQRDGQKAAAIAYLAEVHEVGVRMVYKAHRAHVDRGDPDWAG